MRSIITLADSRTSATVIDREFDLDKIRVSLTTTCAECGHEITPNKLRRVDFERVQCTLCGRDFVPAPKNR